MDYLPTPFTLYPSRKKFALLLIGSIVFVAGGVLMIKDGDAWGWFCATFFGLGIPVFGVQLLPGSSYLRVDDRGIVFRTIFKQTRIDWCDIDEFGVFSMRNHGIAVHNMVGINFSEHYMKARLGRATSRALTGFDGVLPDTYGLKADDLALLLNSYRMRADVQPA